MKTPDEIKDNARTCISQPYTEPCGSCELYPKCRGDVNYNLIALLDLVNEYERRLAQVEREMDALVHFIQKESFPAVISNIPEACQWCKNLGDFTKEVCKFCGTHEVFGNFEFRGVCEENTKDGADV